MEKPRAKALRANSLAFLMVSALISVWVSSVLAGPMATNAAFELPLLGNNSFAENLHGAVFSNQNEALTSFEDQVVELVNGTRAYEYALEMERAGLDHTLSNYSFRATGSSGANHTAKYIMERFQSFGLEAHNESFQFKSWDLPSRPMLTIDDDGNPATTNDQVEIHSFQSTHYSWPSAQGGVFRDLVVLPLPPAASRQEIGLNPIDMNAWNSINTTGRILLTGREVTWSGSWHQTYVSKLSAQPPAAIVLTWWYDWMSFTPMTYASSGGLPLSGWGSYYWSLQIPVGGVDYTEGSWVRNREIGLNVSASFKIESVIRSGLHYNVVGKLRGTIEPEKFIIVSGHYDSVTCAGFCDNGAGTAGVIELARILTDAVESGTYDPKYSILFIAFAGEEAGLVGSVYYVKQHKTGMSDIIAVINLDCIGSDSMYVSETAPSAKGLDLDQLVLQAAADLGVNAALTGTGGSDQESFRDPVGASGTLKYYWGINPGIDDAVPVQASTLMISEPLNYDDQWSIGMPGWIHTSYDNSTSNQALGWVEIPDLRDHLKVAALSIIRVAPTLPPHPFHELAVTNIRCSKTIVGQGYSIQINVTMKNLGDFSETFNITVYAGSTIIEKRETILTSQTQASFTFTWNTAAFAKGSHFVSANATIVASEIEVANNACDDGTVMIVTPGDVNSDGVVNVVDVGGMSAHWYPGPPTGSKGYDPNFDIDNNGVINVIDLSVVSAYWTGPPKGPLAP